MSPRQSSLPLSQVCGQAPRPSVLSGWLGANLSFRRHLGENVNCSLIMSSSQDYNASKKILESSCLKVELSRGSNCKNLEEFWQHVGGDYLLHDGRCVYACTFSWVNRWLIDRYNIIARISWRWQWPNASLGGLQSDLFIEWHLCVLVIARDKRMKNIREPVILCSQKENIIWGGKDEQKQPQADQD